MRLEKGEGNFFSFQESLSLLGILPSRNLSGENCKRRY